VLTVPTRCLPYCRDLEAVAIRKTGKAVVESEVLRRRHQRGLPREQQSRQAAGRYSGPPLRARFAQYVDIEK